ncbi:MAG: sensor histidine kinase [Clostridia bacterium]|nr:sensor histidine kinase [Clostridia bacterium]
MKVFSEVLRKNRAAILLWLLINGFDAAVFVLYGVMLEPLLYAVWISLCLLAVFLAADYLREKKHHEERLRTAETVVNDRKSLPEAHLLAEEDYQAILAALGSELERVTADFSERQVDQMDYYTAWVHQIKTPIAVMKLRLSGDTPEHRQLLAELLRVEQYVDMVLQYIRLGSTSNDLVIREYRLDELIREAVRKFAPLFVEKRLRLDYAPTEETVVTDKKWFVCILEQLISNAIKYTPSGTVTIGVENGVLCISDTGIGIAPEDLPRIFEKGYTGLNGRMGQKSSGLGLYLAKKAADLLAIPLRVESREGEGSRFLLDLKTAP